MRSLLTVILRKIFPDELYKFREVHDKTQEEMAEILDISPRSYSDLELSKTTAGIYTFLMFCIYCCEDVNMLIENIATELANLIKEVA